MPSSVSHRASRLACSLLIAAALAACGGGSSSSPSIPAPPAATLTLSGSSDRAISGGAAVTLTASASDGAAVSWALGAGNPGALSASSGNSINYLPPAAGVGADTPVTITASAGGASKSILLTLRPADYPRLELLAGDDGGSARVDGTGTQARFIDISGAAAEASGNLYITERGGALRKVTPAGVVTTLTSGAPAYVDGPKGTARVLQPLCPVAPASDGSVYFLEGLSAAGAPTGPTNDWPLRKFAADGSISTVARISISSSDTLRLAGGNGKLYAVQGQRISTIAADGTLTTLVGADWDENTVPVDGKGAAARFRYINDVAADGAGNLYVNDDLHVIRKVSADGVTSTLAGAYPTGLPGAAIEPLDGTGAAARFNSMRSLVYTGGKLMVYDWYQSGPVTEIRLRSITTDGVVTSVLTPSQNRLLAGPGSTLYQFGLNQINLLRPDGSTTPLAGKDSSRAPAGDIDGVGADARFGDIFTAMTADPAGNLYVADNLYPGIHMSPSGLALRKVTPAGMVTTIHHRARVWTVAGLVADADGNVYVATFDGNSLYNGNKGGLVYKIAPNGDTVVLAGALPSTGQQDGTGTAARFQRPYVIGLDGNGNLYASDLRDDGVTATYRKITPAGVVTTIAALPARLSGRVEDDAGNYYSVDLQQGTVVRTTPAGVTSTVAGTPGASYTYPGDLPGHLQGPTLVARTGPYRLAVTSGYAIMTIYLPH